MKIYIYIYIWYNLECFFKGSHDETCGKEFQSHLDAHHGRDCLSSHGGLLPQMKAGGRAQVFVRDRMTFVFLPLFVYAAMRQRKG